MNRLEQHRYGNIRDSYQRRLFRKALHVARLEAKQIVADPPGYIVAKYEALSQAIAAHDVLSHRRWHVTRFDFFWCGYIQESILTYDLYRYMKGVRKPSSGDTEGRAQYEDSDDVCQGCGDYLWDTFDWGGFCRSCRESSDSFSDDDGGYHGDDFPDRDYFDQGDE